MKIISHGNNSIWTKQVTCTGCEAELEIEVEDIEYFISDKEAMSQQYDLDPEGTYFVRCPECQTEITIKAKKIPPAIRDKIRY